MSEMPAQPCPFSAGKPAALARPPGISRLTLACLGLAAALRLFLLLRAPTMMNGDEAVLGIQAEQIGRGARPIYFAGQPYMGAWDAYLAAPLIAIFGPSAWVLRAVTFAESLLLVPLVGALAARLYGERARLPALLLAAIPPVYVALGELRVLGGYVETLVLGTALLLCVAEVTVRWRQGRTTLGLWPLLGLIAGLGLWIDPLIGYYLLAAAVWGLPFALWRLRRPTRDPRAGARAGALAGLGAVCACAIGAWPAMVYGLHHAWFNVTVFSHTTFGGTLTDPLRRPIVADFFSASAPLILGTRLLWQDPQWQGLEGPCVLMVAAIVLGLLASGAVHLVRAAAARLADPADFAAPATAQLGRWSSWRIWAAALPVVLFVCIFIPYWRDPSAQEILTLRPLDGNGRYALPLTTVYSLLLAAALAAMMPTIQGWVARRRRHPRSGDAARARSLSAVPSLLAALPLAFLLAAYALPYATTDPVAALQAPFREAANLAFPARDAGLLTYLRQRHVTAVWTNHWIGDTIMYLEDGRVQCADGVDLALDRDAHRFPDSIARLQAASRPSFLVVSDPARGEPATARALDALHVAYTSMHFGPYWIITPTSRTVRPREILSALERDYH